MTQLYTFSIFFMMGNPPWPGPPKGFLGIPMPGLIPGPKIGGGGFPPKIGPPGGGLTILLGGAIFFLTIILPGFLGAKFAARPFKVERKAFETNS